MGKTFPSISKLDCYNFHKNLLLNRPLRDKKNTVIVLISNKYKKTLDNFINSLNLEFLLGLINKKSLNAFRFISSLTGFLEKNCLNKDI